MTCFKNESEDEKYFILHNYSEKRFFNFHFDSFELIIDAETIDLSLYVFDFPSSINPCSEKVFKVCNRYHFSNRKLLSKEMKMIFDFDDEDNNHYICIASKDVSLNTENKVEYMLGEWLVEFTPITRHN